MKQYSQLAMTLRLLFSYWPEALLIGALIGLYALVPAQMIAAPRQAIIHAAAVFAALLLIIHPFGKRAMGWQFKPDVRRVATLADSLCLDESCVTYKTVVKSMAAPENFCAAPSLQPGTSSLPLGVAAALTAPAIPMHLLPALHSLLSSLRINHEHIQRGYPVLSRAVIHDCDAVIVKDGAQQRFYFAGHPQALHFATHIWTDKVYPIDTSTISLLKQGISQQSGGSLFHESHTEPICYFTGLWVNDQPADVTYLGCILFVQEYSDETQELLDQSSLRTVATWLWDSSTLLVAAKPRQDARLQMCCGDGDPADFPHVFNAVKASYKRRGVVTLLFFFFVCMITSLQLIHPVSDRCLIGIYAAPLLAMGYGAIANWEIRLPRWYMLPAVCLPVLIGFFVMLYGIAVGMFPASAMAAFLLICAWEPAVCFFAHQSPYRLPFLIVSAVSWAGMMIGWTLSAGAMPLAFTLVLSTLCVLPLGLCRWR